MITIEQYDFNKEYYLQPLITEFVSAHESLLTFNPNYLFIFQEFIKQTSGHDSKAVYVAIDSSDIVGLITGSIEDNPLELYTQIDNKSAKEFWGSRGFETYLERRKVVL